MTPKIYWLIWILVSGVALTPIYYGLWRLVRVAETIQFILSTTSMDH